MQALDDAHETPDGIGSFAFSASGSASSAHAFPFHLATIDWSSELRLYDPTARHSVDDTHDTASSMAAYDPEGSVGKDTTAHSVPFQYSVKGFSAGPPPDPSSPTAMQELDDEHETAYRSLEFVGFGVAWTVHSPLLVICSASVKSLPPPTGDENPTAVHIFEVVQLTPLRCVAAVAFGPRSATGSDQAVPFHVYAWPMPAFRPTPIQLVDDEHDAAVPNPVGAGTDFSDQLAADATAGTSSAATANDGTSAITLRLSLRLIISPLS